MSFKARTKAFIEKHNKHEGSPPGRCTLAKWAMWIACVLFSLYAVPCWVFSGSLNEEIGGQPYPGLGTVAWVFIYLGMIIVWIIAASTFDYFWHENRPERLERKRRFREAELEKRYASLLRELWGRHPGGHHGTVDVPPLIFKWVKLTAEVHLDSRRNRLVVTRKLGDSFSWRIGLDYDPTTRCLEVTHLTKHNASITGVRMSYGQYRSLRKAIKAHLK